MKMTELKLEPALFTATTSPRLQGFVRFKCGKGEMKIFLTEQDILDIEALLRNKTKELGGEA